MESERHKFMRELLEFFEKAGVEIGESLTVYRGEETWIDDLHFVHVGTRIGQEKEIYVVGYWDGERHAARSAR